MAEESSTIHLPAEVENILSECQGYVQNMYVDVQILKDESYKDANLVYKT